MKQLIRLMAVLAVIAGGSVVLGQATTGGPGPGIATTGFGGFGPGAVATPSIYFAADTTTGFFNLAAGSIGISSSGVGMARFGGGALVIGGGTTPALGFENTFNGGFDLSLRRGGAPGALRILSGTTPTQSGTTCGTGPTITGNNSLGSVTLGTGPGLPCTILFNGTWTAAPHCFLNPIVLTTGTTTVRATGITTGQFVITSTAALVATDKVEWFCVGE